MSQIRIRPVELFCLASEGINMHIICCWLPKTLHGIIVSQATCLWEVPLWESRSSANEIRCEWQSIFSHLSISPPPPPGPGQKSWRLGFCKHIVLPWLLPTLKLIYWFSEISILPLRNIPWLPTQQISALTVNLTVCCDASSKCQRSWGNFYFMPICLLQRKKCCLERQRF